MSNLQINTRVRRLFQYLEDFERGKIQVPPFQRDFVWNNQKKLDLMDSLKNGFPIGSVLFWQPESVNSFDMVDEELQSVGTYQLRSKNNDFYFILDGYQRLSTLFGCFIDPHTTNLHRIESDWKKEFDIVYNLKDDNFEFNRRSRSDLEIYRIPLYHFVTSERFYDFQTDLTGANISEEDKREYIIRYKNFGSKISSYDIPSIDLVGGTIKEAVDIFSRLNSKGERITEDWKVSALSFSRERNFRFGSKIDELFERIERYNFFTSASDRKSKRELILQCVVSAFGKLYFDVSSASRELEQLALQSNFIDVCLQAMDSIVIAVQFLYEELLVLDSRLLPYNSQLIFITQFFNQQPHPHRTQIEKLKRWFWITTYSNYFTIYNLSRQRTAYEYFKGFINDELVNPVFYDKYDHFETIEFPKKIAMNSVRAKALALFMINHAVRNNNIMHSSLLMDRDHMHYDLYRIFNHMEIEEDTNISENTIILVRERSVYRETANRFNFFELFHTLDMGHTENLFVTAEMVFQYNRTNNQVEFLRERLNLIKSSEKLFVESLNMQYEE